MKWFNNVKIKGKLIICFVIVGIFTGIVGFIGILNMGNINARGVDVYNANFLPAQELATMQKNLLLIRGNFTLILYEEDLSTFQQRVDEITMWTEEDKQLLEKYALTIESDEERALNDNLQASLVPYRSLRQECLDLLQLENYVGAKEVVAEFTKARVAVDEAIGKLIDYNTRTASEKTEISSKEFKSQSTLMIAIIIIGIIISMLLGLAVARLISKQLDQLLGVADKMSDGDFNVSIDIDTKDEIGILARAFKKMTDMMNEVMSNINVASEQVASGAKQVSDSSMALSQGATEQASSVEQLTASLEEIGAQTKHNADSANQANSLAETAKGNAVQGNSQMKDMLKAMDEINDASNNISKIIKVIDEIAFQTNILALNAAVEAARAGQHGKGFAVVAEEVRNLAARSANAAKETTEMIGGSIKKVEGGTKIANQTADALNKIVEDVTRVADLVGDIAVASNEQASGIAQVNQGIMQVSDVVQTNSATSEESAAASEELSSQAEMLKDQVSRFKLRKSQRTATSYRGTEDLNPDVLKMLENMEESKKSNVHSEKGAHSEAAATSSKRIVLSDKEFGKY